MNCMVAHFPDSPYDAENYCTMCIEEYMQDCEAKRQAPTSPKTVRPLSQNMLVREANLSRRVAQLRVKLMGRDGLKGQGLTDKDIRALGIKQEDLDDPGLEAQFQESCQIQASLNPYTASH